MVASILCLASCHNQDWNYEDYDYTTVYFAYQSPVRTLVMGEDVFDTTLDNEHECKIMATMGGVYSNDNTVTVNFKVDNSLCDNLYFTSSGEKVKAMPSSYYSLADSKMTIAKGDLMGGVLVKLEDAFFEDASSIETTYVIPLVIESVSGADSVLVGKPADGIENPWRLRSDDWEIVPKDYILYAVKYINKWHGNYLRRGVDVIKGSVATTKNYRNNGGLENDEVCSMSTKDLNTAIFPMKLTSGSKTYSCNLILHFDGNDCTVSCDEYSASGTGTFVEKGEKNSWGNKDRDVLYLDYTINFGGTVCQTKDTLVVRDRGTKMETFTPVYEE